MFADAWEKQQSQATQIAASIKRRLQDTKGQIAGLLDRIVSGSSSERVISAYGSRIETLERQKLALSEKLAHSGKPKRPFDEVFELALVFLSSPTNLWKSKRLEDRQAALA